MESDVRFIKQLNLKTPECQGDLPYCRDANGVCSECSNPRNKQYTQIRDIVLYEDRRSKDEMTLRWPRRQYFFGPVRIQADMIEPFIIPKVRIGVGLNEMFDIKFDNMYQAAEFCHMLSFYDDCPSKKLFDETFGDFEELRKRIKERADSDELNRMREYCEYKGKCDKDECVPKKKKWWWPF